ncbi:MAG: cell division protein FtsX [Rhizomicrobium sp.]
MSAAVPILPPDNGATPLDFVIAVMAFLAALALGASLIADRASEGWRHGLSDKLTVEVLPPGAGDPALALDRETTAALAVLRSTPGIVRAAALSQAELDALVAPWVGVKGLDRDIPLPRLIDVSLVPGASLDVAALSGRLKRAAPDASLDDHRSWIARLSAIAGTVRYSAYLVLLLIAGATAAAVSFATRAGLAAHHEMVALLHQMGARAGFIAHTVERHYLVASFLAALLGTLLAAILFMGAGALEQFGVQAVPFLPPLALDGTELSWLVLVPLAAAAIAWATARISVLSVVHAIY